MSDKVTVTVRTSPDSPGWSLTLPWFPLVGDYVEFTDLAGRRVVRVACRKWSSESGLVLICDEDAP